ncbi:hypothetical protein hrd7_28430 [Leptolinea sp. HRD-7]|nr:hypothetical protein hrd7_28430 [Leptolinea sp. HRD-7]
MQAKNPTPTPLDATEAATVTPYPLLTDTEKETWLMDQLTSNDTCIFPCFLGITPGINEWDPTAKNLEILFGDDVQQPFKPGRSFENYTLFYVDLSPSDDPYTRIGNNDLLFYVRDGKIDGINIILSSEVLNKGNPDQFMNLFKQMSIEKTMLRYGLPDSVYISSNVPMSPLTTFEYTIFLMYNQGKLQFSYSGTGSISGDMYPICPKYVLPKGSIDESIEIFVNASQTGDSLEKESKFNSELFQPINIKDATGLDIKEFYELMTVTENNACFDVPWSLWI